MTDTSDTAAERQQLMDRAVEQARAALIDALVYAGNVIIGNLDGASEADRAEGQRALEEAQLRGITLSTLLAERDGGVASV